MAGKADRLPEHVEALRKITPEVLTRFMPGVTAAAREAGYAVAVHGSLAWDIDLVAVPWTDEAQPFNAAVEAIRAAIGTAMDCRVIIHWPSTRKPWGRRAIHLQILDEGGALMPVIDLSVMPRATKRKGVDARVKPGHDGEV